MKIVVKITGKLFGLMVAAVLIFIAYISVIGFPAPIRRFVVEQLRQQGVSAKFGNIQLDIFSGVVATDASLADASEPEHTLIQMDRAELVWNWRRFFQNRNGVQALQVANATISVPTPADDLGEEKFTASHVFATFVFADDGAVIIDDLTGVYCGIRLQVSGRLKLRAASQPRPSSTGKRPFLFVTKVVRELNSISVTKPPELDLKFDVDLDRPLAGRVQARMFGSDIQYRGVEVDSATVDVEMRDGGVVIKKFNVKLYDGEVNADGRYDVAQSWFDLRVSSTTDPTAFAVVLPAKAAEAVRQVRVKENPAFHVRVYLTPETGSQPQIEGRLHAGALEFRGVPFTSIRCAFSTQGPILKVTDAEVVTTEGRVTGRGQIHRESTDFAYELDSTIDPTKLLPLMFENVKRIVEPSAFETPPHLIANVRGDFVDPENFAYEAMLTADKCSYRGVKLNRASAVLRLCRSRLNAENIVLVRDDGVVRGHLLADFNHQRVAFEGTSTASPSTMAGILGPIPAKFMEPYRFGSNVNIRVLGMVDFVSITNTVWSGSVSADGFAWNEFRMESGAGDVVFTNGSFHVRAKGRGMAWEELGAEKGEYELNVTDGVATLDLKAEGLRLADARALRGKAKLLIKQDNVTGVANLTNVVWGSFSSDTASADFGIVDGVTTATVKTDGFQWWKIKTTSATGRVHYDKDSLKVTEFDGSFYDGKIRGNMEVELANKKMDYSLALRVSDADLKALMDDINEKEQDVTGVLDMKLQLQGQGDDQKSIKGDGKVEIGDGVLWQGALFGVFSRILGKTKATDAKFDFQVADRAVETRNMQIRAGMFTATASGKVDFDANLDFRVQAQFLRSWPGLNIITKIIGVLMEYRVGGTMSDPSYRPINLPKELLPHSD